MGRLAHVSGREIDFTWNGRPITAREGDTVAAALYAAGIRRLAATRKRHQPLGLSGSYIGGVLGQVDGRPNVRLDLEPVRAGLHAASQNHWPSARFDLLALTRFIPARWVRGGFEHPSWIPSGTWRFQLWERLLAFLAGIAEPPAMTSASTLRSDRKIAGRKIDCDVLIVGGGPAGCAAANAEAANGRRVVLASRGDSLSRLASAMGEPSMRLDDRVQFLPETEIFGLYRQGTLAAGAAVRSDGGGVVIAASQIILATGQQSIPPLIRGSHLPGVMDARTAIMLAQRHAVRPGKAVVILGTGAERLIADRLIRLGINVVAVDDIRKLRAIEGRQEVSGVQLDRRVACDAVIHAGPWRTDPGLYFQGTAIGVTYLQPGTPAAHISHCGSCDQPAEPINAAGAANRAALVCPCMDVTADEICDLVAEGETHPEVIKRLTSCGMGPCQGMPCWEVMTSVIATATGRPEAEIRRPVHRAPRRGITVAQAAGMADLVEPDR